MSTFLCNPLPQGIEVAGEKHSIFRAGCARLAGQGLATGRSVTAAEAHLPAFWRPAYRACRGFCRGFRLLKSLRRDDECHTRIHLSKRCVSRSIDANIAATVAPLGACRLLNFRAISGDAFRCLGGRHCSESFQPDRSIHGPTDTTGESAQCAPPVCARCVRALCSPAVFARCDVAPTHDHDRHG